MVENLTIIGTSHIARESVAQVRKVIEDLKPAIVAIELDAARAHALLHKEKGRLRLSDIRRVGVKGFLFSLIGAYVERKLGERVGTAPGSEMKAAIFAAKDVGARIALIDQDIAITLRRFSQTLSWAEKFRLVGDLFMGIFGKGIPFDLSKVPQKELIKKLTREFKRKYPNMYKVLVVERNRVMAKNLAKLLHQMPGAKIVAIVGAGHEEDINRLVNRNLFKLQ